MNLLTNVHLLHFIACFTLKHDYYLKLSLKKSGQDNATSKGIKRAIDRGCL